MHSPRDRFVFHPQTVFSMALFPLLVSSNYLGNQTHIAHFRNSLEEWVLLITETDRNGPKRTETDRNGL